MSKKDHLVRLDGCNNPECRQNMTRTITTKECRNNCKHYDAYNKTSKCKFGYIKRKE